MSKTADAARGRWPSILTSVGFPAEALVNKHGPCPLGCGGKKSFRFDNKEGRGTWICSHCGAGEGVELVKQFLGLDAREALKRVDELLPQAIVAPAPKPKDFEREKRRIKEIWRGSRPFYTNDAVGQYLKRRLGYVPEGLGLRCHPGLDYYEGTEKVGNYPAMIAAVWLGDRVVGLHRTFLSDDGHKAPVPAAKKLVTCVESIAGAAIRLGPAAPVMGVAEGIETALAASREFTLPVWATISANGMDSFAPPPVVQHLDIFADHDINGTGQLAAYKLLNRLALHTSITAAVHIPPTPGTDWAD